MDDDGILLHWEDFSPVSAVTLSAKCLLPLLELAIAYRGRSS
jgi:hypothetical protein